jgi:signal transduction histidine kinase
MIAFRPHFYPAPMPRVRPTVNPRAVDAALVVLSLALTALAVKTPWSPLPAGVIAVAGAGGSVALWWRRDRPVAACVAGAVAYALSGNPGPLLVGVYSGASYAHRKWLWIPGLAGAAGFMAYSWIDAGKLTLADTGWALLSASVVTLIGAYTAARRALFQSMQDRAESAETQKQLLEQQARSQERARIAAEMHDVLAHKVSLIALHAGALELAASGAEPKVRDGAALIRVTAREALQELRSVLGMLRTDLHPPSDLATLVGASVSAGQPVELTDDAGPLPPALARVVYRIAQEGLTNAHKYAPHAPTTVAVHREDGSVIVTVHNERSRAAVDLPGSGSGLIGLAERVQLVGGTIHSGPEADGGWRLRAVLPGEER